MQTGDLDHVRPASRQRMGAVLALLERKVGVARFPNTLRARNEGFPVKYTYVSVLATKLLKATTVMSVWKRFRWEPPVDMLRTTQWYNQLVRIL